MKKEKIYTATYSDVIKWLDESCGRSAWRRAVNVYCHEMLYMYEEAPSAVLSSDTIMNVCLNGAKDWLDYSVSGTFLNTEEEIAERLCTPSELKRCRNSKGDFYPRYDFAYWFGRQAAALSCAASRIRSALFWVNYNATGEV